MAGKKKRIYIVSFLMLVVVAVVVILYINNLGLNPSAAPAFVPVSEKTSGLKVTTSKLSATTNAQLPGMEALMENDKLLFFMNRETAEFAILDKQKGQIWHSNPQDRDQDKIAAAQIKGKLAAQLSLVYLMPNGHTKDYDSYNDSVTYKQFEVQQTEDSVVVTFHFGNPEKGVEALPEKISKERFEEKLLNKLEGDEKNKVKSRYKLIASLNVYERRDIPKSALKQLIKLFEKAGYTEEDLAVDNKENSVASSGSGNAKFTVSLKYTLDGGSLVALVDTAKLEESAPYKIQSINILENFGAAGPEAKGYMLLPDGSGSLVYLNNGRNLAQPIQVPVYGEDQAIAKPLKQTSYEITRLPVFGIKNGDRALFSIIEEGDGLAKISADISGRQNDYNQISSSFTILPSDSVKLSNEEEMIKTPKLRYMGPLQVRYSFLYDDKANYSGMAELYRNYLVNRYGLKKLPKGGDAPFYLELTGSVTKQKNFIGVPYDSLIPLSDFEGANKLLDELSKDKVNNIQLNYKGWFNDGLRHDIPTKVSLDGVLGSKDEWLALADRLSKNGGQLYPDVAFQRVYGGRFNASKDSVQQLSRKNTAVYRYDPAMYVKDYERFSYYALSPSVLGTVVEDFLDRYSKYNPGAVSLRDLAEDISSDFRNGREVTREESKRIIQDQFKQIHDKAANVMVSGGNEYALPYAKHVLNAPQISNEFQLSNESVPFYEMVLHGYVEYAGKPFNIQDDQNMRRNVLKSVETGSNVYYSWVISNAELLKNTKFDDLYSNYYEYWYKDAVAAYREVNGVLSQVKGQAISSHQKLADGVYRTTFENGKSVYVNYGSEPATVDGVTIEAENYKVEG